jgi:hypothetical protein
VSAGFDGDIQLDPKDSERGRRYTVRVYLPFGGLDVGERVTVYGDTGGGGQSAADDPNATRVDEVGFARAGIGHAAAFLALRLTIRTPSGLKVREAVVPVVADSVGEFAVQGVEVAVER